MSVTFKKQPTKSRIFQHPAFRPFLVLVFLLILISYVLIKNNVNNKAFAGARPSADAFVTAISRCDVRTATYYYPPLHNSQVSDNFKKSCLSNPERFSYFKQLSTSGALEKSSDTRKVVLEYIVHEKDNSSTHLKITLYRKFNTPHWLIQGITAVPNPNAPSPNSSNTAPNPNAH